MLSERLVELSRFLNHLEQVEPLLVHVVVIEKRVAVLPGWVIFISVIADIGLLRRQVFY